MIESPRPAVTTTDEMEAGDALARSGDWHGAIDYWERAAHNHAERREQVERRLVWLLDHTEPQPGLLSRRSVRLVIGTAVTALLGTLLVLIAPEPGSTGANLLAIAAWVLFLASATMAVIAARGRPTPNIDQLLRRARASADGLAHHHEDPT